MTQVQLIDKLKIGDNQAFREFVNQYRKDVLNLCYGFVRNQEDAEDIAQEVFIEVYRSISNFRGDSKLSTWIYRIAVSRSLNKVKKNKFKNLLTSFENLFDQNALVSNNDPHNQLQSKDQAKLVQKTIDKLSENQRIAFVLHHYDGYSYLQIAEIMNNSIPSVESLIHRAKVSLQKQLINIK